MHDWLVNFSINHPEQNFFLGDYFGRSFGIDAEGTQISRGNDNEKVAGSLLLHYYETNDYWLKNLLDK